MWISTCVSAEILGKIQVDDTWEPKVYLSLINSFEDLNTASYDFLIAETSLNQQGEFSFNSLALPTDERLYRLHMCKKGDPVSTIIMGGKHENFIHFIAHAASNIKVVPGKTKLFTDHLIHGHPANESLNKLFLLRQSLINPPEIPSVQNRELQRIQVLNNLKIVADTSNTNIIKLLALHYIGDYFGYSRHLDFVKSISLKTCSTCSANCFSFSTSFDEF